MNKRSGFTFITTFIFALLLIFILPAPAEAQPPDAVHLIRGTAEKLTPPLDGDVASEKNIPVFAVEEGCPAYFCPQAGVWEKFRTLTKQWEEQTSGTFGSGLWRFKIQVRIDKPLADDFELSDPVDVYLNDEYLGQLTDIDRDQTGSYGYIYTKPAKLTRSVGILHYGYLSPEVSYHYMGETVYIETTVPNGYYFDHWECSSKLVPFAIHSLRTSFVMPDEDVVFTPIHEKYIMIDETSFPDKAFRDLLLKIDIGKDGCLTESEINSFTHLDCSSSSIHDLTGIENFTALKRLYCQNNELETLDVSSLYFLEILNCSNNHLICLDLSHNNGLKKVFISNSTREIKDRTPISQLPGFDISKVGPKRTGGRFEDGQIRFNNASDQFKFTYHCSNAYDMYVILKRAPEIITGQWLSENGKWWYRHDDGSYTRNDFEEINDKVYFFDESGYMVTGWKEVNQQWYYLNENGVMVTSWQTIGPNEYYFFNDGTMFKNREVDGKHLGPTGAVVYGQWEYSPAAGKYWYNCYDGTYPHDEFKGIEGHTYYFDNSGYMAVGWTKVNDIYYYFNQSGHMVTGWQQIGGVWYYFNDSGAMATGWQQIGGVWYYFNDSGAMVTGWQQIGGVWYYFNSSGAMMTGWQQIGSSWYYFNSSGAMMTGWQWIAGSCYYFYSDGSMASNTTIGGSYVNASGVWVN